MKYFQFRYIFIVTLCILLGSLISVTGCNNTESNIVLADYEEISQKPPIELTIGQLYEDYITDPIAADDEYKGKRLCFYEVKVEEVVSFGATGKQYFITGDVKFILRSTSKMQNVEQSYVLNLVGECRGIDNTPSKVVTIKDCWVESVIGDLGEDEWFNPY